MILSGSDPRQQCFLLETVPNVDTIVAGTPAYGAFVSANDGLSQVVKAIQTGSPPFAEFQLISVATGTWIVFVDTVEQKYWNFQR